MAFKPFSRKTAAGLVAFLAWSVVFALIYTQSPLYASNQNQYFLHGMARAGYGFLSNDWLARTLDPTPVFSLLIEYTYRIFHGETATYIYYGLLMGVYGYALWGIADFLFHLRQSAMRTLAFLTAFLILHSTVLRFFLSRIWDGESAYLFEGGVAFQRVLGQFFQPSTFGVFLLLSLCLFLRNRRGLSILSLAVAVYFHSTYLLAGALITLGYLFTLWREEGRASTAFRFGLLSLAAVIPILLYTALVFSPTTPELYRQAQYILVHYRIPQHALISWWLRWTAYAQVGLLIGALCVVRKTRLFPILAAASLGMLLLTLAQAMTGSDALALLFPWRISVILVPLSSTILLAAGIRLVSDRLPISGACVHHWFTAGCLAAIACLVAAGVIRFWLDTPAPGDPSEAVFAYIRVHAQPDDVFFVPPRMETFRLETGAPAFIDLKSIPYRDEDVLEWNRRIQIANTVYDSGTDLCLQSQQITRQEGVSIFLLPTKNLLPSCPAWLLEYRDAEYSLVRILPADKRP